MRAILYLIESNAKAVTIEAASPFGANTMTLPLGHVEFMAAWEKWQGGEMIQQAFQTLNAEQREFLLTGMSIKQQREIFGVEHDPINN